MAIESHIWNDEFCSCGQDSVTCQCCGRRVCGTMTQHLTGLGNICWMCRQSYEDKTIEQIQLLRARGWSRRENGSWSMTSVGGTRVVCSFRTALQTEGLIIDVNA